MGGGIIKSIILGIILVVLAFVLGSQAADGTTAPLLILGILCGLFVFNYLGPRCWCLLFIMPPLLQQLPFGIVQRFPIHYGVAGVILLYWVVMWAMGYVRFTWNGVKWMDAISLLPLILMAMSFYSHPVSINALDLDVDAVGGEVYLWAAGAAIYYLALSCIPVTYQDLGRVYKIGFFITVAFILLFLPKTLMSAGSLDALGNQMEGGRYGAFARISTMGLNLLFCAYPLMRIMLSPWRFAAMMLGLIGTALSGYRGIFLESVFPVVFMAMVRRQFLSFCLLAISGYGILIYAGEEHMLDNLPHGIQRSLAILPGVEVGRDADASAQSSNKWRYELWGLALDRRSGYIKDYIWGDGFGVSKRMMEREHTHNWRRGYVREASQVSYFAENGVWHLSLIIWIHRLGIVGAFVFLVWLVASLVMLFRVAPVLLTKKGSLFLLVAVSNLFPGFIIILVSAGSPRLIFPLYSTVALIKVTYSLLVKEGSMPPLFSRRVYVPLLIREQEEEMLKARTRPRFLPRKGEL